MSALMDQLLWRDFCELDGSAGAGRAPGCRTGDVYAGFDPAAATTHMGHLVQLEVGRPVRGLHEGPQEWDEQPLDQVRILLVEQGCSAPAVPPGGRGPMLPSPNTADPSLTTATVFRL